jgi:hypothetical protein
MQASVPQNDSRHPLTRLLGNGGNIRVLRALAEDDLPLSVTQLAERCGLTPQGTRLALEPLVEGRLVRLLGGARARLFTIEARHPFAKSIRTLFGQEQAQWERLHQALRGLLHKDREVVAAWYLEPAAGADASDGRSLSVWLVLAGSPVEASCRGVPGTLCGARAQRLDRLRFSRPVAVGPARAVGRHALVAGQHRAGEGAERARSVGAGPAQPQAGAGGAVRALRADAAP